MELIENNPFRVLGLPITASAREIEKRATELETYASMGKTKSYDTDFNFKPVLRTLENIKEARKKLHLDEEKFRHSLFWFWNHNSVDELAFELLRDGNVDKAIAIWEKAVFSDKQDAFIQVPIIEDLISTSSGWPELDNDDHRLEIDGDAYVIERKNAKITAATTLADFDDSERWLIECDAEWMAGDDNCAFGLVIGRGNNSFFSFDISANGYYRFGRTIDWNFENIIEWTKDDDDVIAGYDLNHIEVEREVNNLILRINGFVVGTVPHEPFFGNSFGFRVSGEQTVHFTKLKLSKFELDQRYASGVEITNKNFSCAKNLALLHLYRAAPHNILKPHLWEPAISLFAKLASSDHFDRYVKAVAGERFVPNWNETIDYQNRLLVDALKPSLDKTYGVTTGEFIDTFSVFPDKNFQTVKDIFVAGSIQKINKSVQISEEQRKADASKAVDAGKALISSVENEIARLSKNLGTSSIEYQLASDKVVDELVQCGIDHSHKAFDPELELPLLKYAASIAITPRSVERVNKNLRTCEVAIPEKQIINLLEKTRSNISSTPRNAISVGERFVADSKAHLLSLRDVAGNDSVEYKRAADAVSGMIIQCAIAYFNSTKNDEPGLPLYQHAVSLAVSSEAKKYANENLASCKEWIKNKDYMLCYFCGENEPQKETSITNTMYLETSRDRHFNSTSVGYSYGDVLVPRCLSCTSVHEAITSYYTKFFFSVLGGLAAGFIGGVLIYPHFKNSLWRMGVVLTISGWSFVFLSLIVTGLICALLAYFFISRVDTNNIRKKHDINGFPEISKRLSQGWTFSKPSA